MRTKVLLVSFLASALLVSACKKKPPPQQDPEPQPQPVPVSATAAQTGTPPVATAPVIILLDAAPPPPEANAALTVVKKLGDARSAPELTPLYAPKVIVNGGTIPAADHVKKKLAAEAEQQVAFGEPQAEVTADGKETFVHFAKKLTNEKGDTTKETTMFVMVRDGVIVEESEEPEDWCKNKDKTVNTKTLPGMKLSAASAVSATKDSKHFAEVKKKVPHLGTDLFGFACAKRCAIPKRECGFHFRVSDMSTDNSNQVVEWVYVEPTSKLLWWQEKDWQSEQLK